MQGHDDFQDDSGDTANWKKDYQEHLKALSERIFKEGERNGVNRGDVGASRTLRNAGRGIPTQPKSYVKSIRSLKVEPGAASELAHQAVTISTEGHLVSAVDRSLDFWQAASRLYGPILLTVQVGADVEVEPNGVTAVEIWHTSQHIMLASEVAQQDGAFRDLLYRTTSTGPNHISGSATVRLRLPDGSRASARASSNGPIGAIYNAINELVRISFGAIPELVGYQVTALHVGTASDVQVSTVVTLGSGKVTGVAEHHDLGSASALAYLAAINQLYRKIHGA